MGPVLNTVIGAAIKLGANLVNFWLEQRRQDQLMLAARDNETLQAILKNQAEQAKDPFVKVTRRILFLSITFTMCFLMIFYALNPHITYDVIVPKGESAKWGIFSWLTGAEEWTVVQMTGGLLLTSFFDLCFMVVGFYAIPSKRR
jgi:hypothetical protein|tara:strand:- start:3806 stop:4240 length:435 start_codon:yes stop_codon:yes gene_type:complete